MKSNKYTNKHTSDASYWLGVGFTVQKYCFSGWKIDRSRVSYHAWSWRSRSLIIATWEPRSAAYKINLAWPQNQTQSMMESLEILTEKPVFKCSCKLWIELKKLQNNFVILQCIVKTDVKQILNIYQPITQQQFFQCYSKMFALINLVCQKFIVRR